MSSNKEIKYARSATHHHAFSLVTVGYPSAHTPIRHISMTLVSSCPRRSIQTLIQCSLTPAGSSLRLELQSYLLLLNSFLCFVECTEAANHLYISQQGLSRQIASLEKELELRLFDRTTRDVRLTRSGELLLWRWKDIPKEIYDSVDMAREEGERAKRRINLSVVGMSGIIEMAGNILADYMAFDPEVEFEINEFTNIKDITNGNPDLMMTVSFTPSYEQLKEKCGLMVIKKLPLYYVMSKKNPLAQKEDVVMEDFKGETMLCLFKNFFAGAELRLFELIAKQEHVLQKARYYENVNSLELAIIANEGIHIGFKEFYHNYGERLVMHPMPNSRNQAYASVIIVWRKENEKRLESFIKFLKNNYN